jgi:hypothetical protein
VENAINQKAIKIGKAWITSAAKLSPGTRGIKNLSEKIEKI